MAYQTMYTIFVFFFLTFGCARLTTKTADNSRPYEAEIQPESGSSWGEWGMEDFCPEGSLLSFLHSFFDMGTWGGEVGGGVGLLWSPCPLPPLLFAFP